MDLYGIYIHFCNLIFDLINYQRNTGRRLTCLNSYSFINGYALMCNCFFGLTSETTLPLAILMILSANLRSC